jgi:hypothetical protein
MTKRRGAQFIPMGKSMICIPSELDKYFIDKEPQCNGDLVAVFALNIDNVLSMNHPHCLNWIPLINLKNLR